MQPLRGTGGKSIQIQLSYIYNKVLFTLIELKVEGKGWLSILEIIVKNPVDKLKWQVILYYLKFTVKDLLSLLDSAVVKFLPTALESVENLL